jgi:hypothetical protein
MPILNWNLIAKWGAALVLLIAPVLYHFWAMADARDAGMKAGYSQRDGEYVKAEAARLKQENILRGEELRKAQKRAEENENLNRKVRDLQGKLDAAFENTPVPAGCKFNADVTSLLRAAAAGDFNPINDAALGGPNGKVPYGTSPNVGGGDEPSRHGAGLRGSGKSLLHVRK